MSIKPFGFPTTFCKGTLDKRSSQDLVNAAWREFYFLIFNERIREIEPFVEQAKFYYLDAHKSDWRSGGLLYYYSFLNLAKAYLIREGGFLPPN